MWNPFRPLSDESRWKQLDQALTDAFEKVKAERRMVFSWLNYLRKKDLANDKLQQKIQHTLGRQEAEIAEIKSQLKELRVEIKAAIMEAKTPKISPETEQVRTKSGPESGPVSGLKSAGAFVNRIVSMIRPQRKEYVMQKMLEFIEKGSYTTKQLETVIVREKGLCGRTAFYDYLKELKYKKMVKQSEKSGRKLLISEKV